MTLDEIKCLCATTSPHVKAVEVSLLEPGTVAIVVEVSYGLSPEDCQLILDECTRELDAWKPLGTLYQITVKTSDETFVGACRRCSGIVQVSRQPERHVFRCLGCQRETTVDQGGLMPVWVDRQGNCFR